jgi:hypothetical protein
MGCNCKTKKKVDKLIKSQEEINRSSSKNYVKGNKTLRKIFFNSLSLIIYTVFTLSFVIFIIPIFLYMIVSRKGLVIRPYKLFKNEQ